MAILGACSKEEAVIETSKPEVKVNMENTVLNSELSKSIGYKSLSVAAGEYTVDYCEGNYGTVCFKLDSIVKGIHQSSTAKNGFGPRIRIATRKSGCLTGIGFRCGLVTVQHNVELIGERDKLVEIDIDEESNIMTMEFAEFVDWEKLKNE